MNIITVEKNYNALVPGTFNYKVTHDDNQVSYVPHNEANKDYQAIQQWISEGNTVIDNGE